MIWFQFLIGRLRTEGVYDEIAKLQMFQFLIGRLRTPLVSGTASEVRGFNSS